MNIQMQQLKRLLFFTLNMRKKKLKKILFDNLLKEPSLGGISLLVLGYKIDK